MKAVHVTISGRVQGVGYRSWTVGQAKKLGLIGWVRNRSDGTVEAMFQGQANKVEEMLERCRKGPLAARVTEIKAEDTALMTETTFTQRPTA